MDFTLPEEREDTETNVDPYAPDGALAALFKLCQEMGLPLPPLPEALLPLLEEVNTNVFTSRSGMDSLQERDRFVAEAATGEAVPFVAFSHEGHGVNDWFIRYYVVLPNVALFVELPFGGAYMDESVARMEIEQAWDNAEKLLAAALAGTSEDSYVIEHRGWRGSRWCVPGPDAQWRDADNAIDAVSALLSPREAPNTAEQEKPSKPVRGGRSKERARPKAKAAKKTKGKRH